MTRYNDSIFLDSSFLIAYQVEGHVFYAKVVSLLKDFYVSKACLVLYTLIMDEVWYVTKNLKYRGRAAGSLEDEVRQTLNVVTKNILAMKGLKIVNPVFKKTDLLEMPAIMSKYNLRPRDALIVKSMELLGVKKIVTFDSDFERVKGISVVK